MTRAIAVLHIRYGSDARLNVLEAYLQRCWALHARGVIDPFEGGAFSIDVSLSSCAAVHDDA